MHNLKSCKFLDICIKFKHKICKFLCVNLLVNIYICCSFLPGSPYPGGHIPSQWLHQPLQQSTTLPKSLIPSHREWQSCSPFSHLSQSSPCVSSPCFTSFASLSSLMTWPLPSLMWKAPALHMTQRKRRHTRSAIQR